MDGRVRYVVPKEIPSDEDSFKDFVKSTDYKTSALTKAIIITDNIHGEAEVICKEDLDGFTI